MPFPPAVHLTAAFANAARMLAAAPMQAAITVVLMRAGEWQPWLDQAQSLLSGAEAQRVARRHFQSDRNALALAYALHRLVLGRLLGLGATQVPLDRDPRGCPQLAGPLAYTSLSHADGLIAVAVAPAPVGVDIEPRQRTQVMAAIAHCVLHIDEVAALPSQDGPARNAALLGIWVRKEAVLKAAGVGLSVPMESFAAPSRAHLALPALVAGPLQIRMLDVGPDGVAAVAGPAGVPVACHWLRPVLV